MHQKLSNLEKIVIPRKDLICKESKLLTLTSMVLFYIPRDEHGAAIVRINIEFQGQIIGNPESRMLVNEEYRTNKNAHLRYRELNEKLNNGKYELDLSLLCLGDVSIKFLE